MHKFVCPGSFLNRVNDYLKVRVSVIDDFIGACYTRSKLANHIMFLQNQPFPGKARSAKREGPLCSAWAQRGFSDGENPLNDMNSGAMVACEQAHLLFG